MAPTPNSALLAAHLREDTADLLALLPAARRAAAGGPGGGEATLDGIARAAYRTLRTAENLAAHAALCTAPPHPRPVCVTALAAAYVSGAAGVCRSAVFVPEWPRAPLWAMGDAPAVCRRTGQFAGQRGAVWRRAARNIRACGAARGNAASHCGRQRPGMRALRRGPRPGPWA